MRPRIPSTHVQILLLALLITCGFLLGAVRAGVARQATAAPAEMTLNTTVRDFKIEHPDFEPTTGGFVTGLVRTSLGPDGKPVLAEPYGRGSISGPETFSQWYNDVPGVNLRTTLPLTLTETSPGSGIFRFSSSSFFPIDDQLWEWSSSTTTYSQMGPVGWQPGSAFTVKRGTLGCCVLLSRVMIPPPVPMSVAESCLAVARQFANP